ncbi:MAG: hypothetical protein WKG00_32135 [Polyangiaceae bacterium]
MHLRAHQLLAPLALCALCACDSSKPLPPAPARGAPLATAGQSPTRTSTTRRAAVEWPAAERIDATAAAALPEKSAEALRRAPVPVLLPADAALLKGGILLASDEWYSWTATRHLDDGAALTLVVSGTRVVHVHAHIPPARGTTQVRGRDAFLTRNEAVPSATWQENGISYTVDIECSSPVDARCADEALLRELTEGLVYVGGAGEAGAR